MGGVRYAEISLIELPPNSVARERTLTAIAVVEFVQIASTPTESQNCVKKRVHNWMLKNVIDS